MAELRIGVLTKNFCLWEQKFELVAMKVNEQMENTISSFLESTHDHTVD